MNANKPEPDVGSTWIDPDDAPELTDEWFEAADLYRDGKLVRLGRPTAKHLGYATSDLAHPDSNSSVQIKTGITDRGWVGEHAPV